MKRREFIENSTKASILLGTLPVLSKFSVEEEIAKLQLLPTKEVDEMVLKNFKLLLKWLRNEGWIEYLQKELQINLDRVIHEDDLSILTKKLPESTIKKMAEMKKGGLDDFGGQQLIKRGAPSLSLLYHILASPRVQSKYVKSYPTLSQLDPLEDYIYSLVDYENSETNGRKFHRMVLAYEYRPAFKVPPYSPHKSKRKECHAQLVFSRSGIARIGDKEMNYNARWRSFTNLPAEKGAEKNIAVMPARYGLFWVEIVKGNTKSISVMVREKRDNRRSFIRPIGKICNTKKQTIEFAELHRIEKLKKVSEYTYKNEGIEFNKTYDFDLPPFTKISATTDQGKKLHKHQTDSEFVKLEKIGSTALLSSIPANLSREVKDKDNCIVNIKVPKAFGKKLGHTNRRYAALKLQNEKGRENTNVVLSYLLFRKNRRTTGLRAPKIAPLFLNIKYEVKDNGEGIECAQETIHLDGHTKDFYDKIHKRDTYYAQVFEDSICDGCIVARIFSDENQQRTLSVDSKQIAPAFSIATAPDFFPLLDSLDLRSYYFNNRCLDTDEDFYEGGTINLSQIRLRANQTLDNPFDRKSDSKDLVFDRAGDVSKCTVTAVVSKASDAAKQMSGSNKSNPFKLNFDRKYQATSFLPDTGTGVFFPGWDATYSGKRKDSYLATFGLGSPFPEDMKLCAAANGMWPVTSPDAGRTFQGSLEPIGGRIPNTSIPLLDEELGRNKRSPFCKYYNNDSESFGWDGEQGPFLETKDNDVYVNFTDINRADYIQNLQTSGRGFDMSILRNLESQELINRMDCLRRCVKTIDRKKVWKTKMWLVCAEKVADWSQLQNLECLPKVAPFDTISFNKKQSQALDGPGYFYVFVLAPSEKKKEKKNWDESDPDKKRRLLKCNKIWLCQVTPDALSFLTLDTKKGTTKDWNNKPYSGCL